MNDAEMSQATNERMTQAMAFAENYDDLRCGVPDQLQRSLDVVREAARCACDDSDVYDGHAECPVHPALPASAIGEVNPHTGHMIIDQVGNVVLGWRFRVSGPDRQPHSDYVTWTLFETWDHERGFDAGDYHDGPGALERAVRSLMVRSGHTPLGG